MSSYDPYGRARARPQRGTFTYWVPLVFTVTAATVGIAAWIWSERRDDEDEHPPPPSGSGFNPSTTAYPESGYPPQGYPQGPGYPQPGYPQQPPGNYQPQAPGYPSGYPPVAGEPYGRNPDGSIRTGPPSYAELRPGEVAYGADEHQQPQSYIAQMSGALGGALRRTPSPQQFIDGATRSVAAGVAAAGAAVGSALFSIREENAYPDHKTWSEEAEVRRPGTSPDAASRSVEKRPSNKTGTAAAPATGSSNRRRTVAIVVSADSGHHDGLDDEDNFHEHTSILSHLPQNTDFSNVRLFVLIYAPGLKEHPLDSGINRPPGSLSSSFSNIGHEQAQTPTDEKPSSSASSNPTFNAAYSEALALVEKETMVLPFTSTSGHVHILRHLNPDMVYLQETLAGHNGDIITHLQTWLRQDVVLIVGAEGNGGLADSESEAEGAPKEHRWWKSEDRVGLGRGVVVVEGLRVGDDWAKRVEQKE